MNDTVDIVCVASTPNRAVARAWRAALEAEGIDCQVGESLTTWLSSAPLTQMDLWVESIHLDHARKVLQLRVSRKPAAVYPE
jgi:hypothetical protein